MDRRGIHRAPHAVVVGEGGIHHQDVADELVVGVVVGDVVEDDQRIEKGYGENECCFSGAESHGFSRRGEGLEVGDQGVESGVVVFREAGHLRVGIFFFGIVDVSGEITG